MSKNYPFHDLIPESQDPIIQAYIKIILNGLPKTKDPKRIAIVGAGMSGMISGLLLAQAGHKVTLYEGDTRIGGRIYTLRGEKYFGREDLYAEAGAMRLPLDIHHLLRTLICKLGVPINRFFQVDVDPSTLNDQDQNAVICQGEPSDPPTKAYNSWTVVNGVKVRTKDYLNAEFPAASLGYDIENMPDAQQKMNGSEMLDMLTDWVRDFVNKNPVENWPEAIEKFDQYSIHGFFKEFSLLSDTAVEFVEVLQNLESRSALSFVQNLIEIALINSDNSYWEITEGSDNLVRALIGPLKEAGVDVYFDQRLTSVDWSEDGTGGVTLGFQPGNPGWDGEITLGAELAGDGFQAQVQADETILTIPVPAMRVTDFTPMLPQGKRKLIRTLYYDSAIKILLSFDRRFWEQDDNIWGGGSLTDQANRMIYYPSHKMGSDAGVVLAVYTWETEARGWNSLTEDERIEYALDGLAKVHGEQIREHFIKGTSWSWDESSWAFGEGAMFAPGQLSELQALTAPPVGNVHFAGDWTTLRHAWIEGAIESGIRVALEFDGTDEKLLRPIEPIVLR